MSFTDLTIDKYGRVTLPMEYREYLGIKNGTILEIVLSECIFLRLPDKKKLPQYSSKIDKEGRINIPKTVLKALELGENYENYILQCFLADQKYIILKKEN